MKYCFLLLLLFPWWAEAVSFSELAWMGDSSSANHEWIELYNGSESVSVNGWSITDGMNLEILLSGDLPADSYVVLERSSEDSAPGESFLIYTGALVNTGTTLVLKNKEGEVVDQVSGGENWINIGGDNVTKETAQYTTKGWVTDIATPGKENLLGRVMDTVSSSTTNTSKTSTQKKPSITTPIINEIEAMAFSVEHQGVAYVGQPVLFKATPKHKNGNDNYLYHWNFGDTHATSGTLVYHTYEYPGNYAILVTTKKKKEEFVVRNDIVVVPVDISVAFGTPGVVFIHNDAPYDVDVSNYVVSAEKSVKFPARSVIKTGGTITLGGRDLGSWKDGIFVKDRNGKLIVQKFINENINKEYSSTEVLVKDEEIKEETLISSDSDSLSVDNKLKETIYIKADDVVEDNGHKDNRIYVFILMFGILILFVVYLRKGFLITK